MLSSLVKGVVFVQFYRRYPLYSLIQQTHIAKISMSSVWYLTRTCVSCVNLFLEWFDYPISINNINMMAIASLLGWPSYTRVSIKPIFIIVRVLCKQGNSSWILLCVTAADFKCRKAKLKTSPFFFIGKTLCVISLAECMTVIIGRGVFFSSGQKKCHVNSFWDITLMLCYSLHAYQGWWLYFPLWLYTPVGRVPLTLLFQHKAIYFYFVGVGPWLG